MTHQAELDREAERVVGTAARERFGPVHQREAVVADEPFLVLGRAEQATTLIWLEECAGPSRLSLPGHPAARKTPVILAVAGSDPQARPER